MNTLAVTLSLILDYRKAEQDLGQEGFVRLFFI